MRRPGGNGGHGSPGGRRGPGGNGGPAGDGPIAVGPDGGGGRVRPQEGLPG